ncbi:MAG: hypothetical protein JW782_04895 [Candidatus Saganbacteria bacterium]|nr:hypothetical protein [Candidatus Saganbacteria bacterium]
MAKKQQSHSQKKIVSIYTDLKSANVSLSKAIKKLSGLKQGKGRTN